MKKDFKQNEKSSIINRIYSAKNMFINSKFGKLAVRSFLCFAFGAIATSVTVAAFSQSKKNLGQGGLETTSSEVIFDSDEDLRIVYEETESKTEVKQEEKTETKSEAKPAELTYFTYRVKQGDMIGKIAEKYNVTQDAIISVNNIKQSRLIQIGQYIKIPSMTGILYTVKGTEETPETVAQKYDISAEKCALINSTKTDASFAKGATIFLPDAQLDWATRQEINGDLFRRPLRVRYYLSSPYGWRSSPITGKRTFHGGIDMACATGNAVYAVLDGTVSATGYNATYGNYVIITHHSGYKTLYGHLSAITCKKGNFVYTTTQIGRVGSTGASTGPHLHFTVYKYNKTVNPLSLIQ